MQVADCMRYVRAPCEFQLHRQGMASCPQNTQENWLHTIFCPLWLLQISRTQLLTGEHQASPPTAALNMSENLKNISQWLCCSCRSQSWGSQLNGKVMTTDMTTQLAARSTESPVVLLKPNSTTEPAPHSQKGIFRASEESLAPPRSPATLTGAAWHRARQCSPCAGGCLCSSAHTTPTIHHTRAAYAGSNWEVKRPAEASTSWGKLHR